MTRATEEGYAADLNEAELVTVGKDPFLVAYGLVSTAKSNDRFI